MSIPLRTRALALVSALLFAAACADPVGQPAPAPSADLVGGVLGGVTGGLLSCAPLPYDSATQVIGPNGGTLRVGPHVFHVPAGSLDSSVAITATIVSGTTNTIRFQPEGLKFAKPAQLTMSYANCSLLGILAPKRVAYVDANQSILDYVNSVDDVLQLRVRGKIKHFSDYAVAW